jgi:hypothetical protein
MLLVLIARAGRDAAWHPDHTTPQGAAAVVYPMQYELERTYHQRCEANAARQRLIEEAERTYSAATTSQPSPFEVAVRVWRRVVSSRFATPSNARLTDSLTDA